MWDWQGLLTWNSLFALLTLTSLEVVLGIDNVIFIAILTGKLPQHQQRKARNIGLSLAAVIRVALLLGVAWIMQLTRPLFTIWTQEVSGKDLILLGGGLFLIAKATFEIHDKLETPKDERLPRRVAHSFTTILLQILALDIVFSLDSIITAVGMSRQIPIMIAAILIAVGVMIAFAGPISAFVERHPTMRMLALAFLVLIGVLLVAEGFHQEIPRGYIYFAMAFSFLVELLNLRARKAHRPLHLYTPHEEPGPGAA